MLVAEKAKRNTMEDKRTRKQRELYIQLVD